MKRPFMLIITLLLASMPCVLFVKCTKDAGENRLLENPMNNAGIVKSNATIIGPDKRDCSCCGGYFLSIDKYKPVAGEYFLTYNFPEGFVPKSFPIKVTIEWQHDRNACVNDKINILKIILPSG